MLEELQKNFRKKYALLKLANQKLWLFISAQDYE